MIDELAAARMVDRKVTQDDISNLGHNGKLVEIQKIGRFVIEGSDIDGEDLVIIVELRGSTYIITVGSMKKTTFNKYYLEYVTVTNVPMVKVSSKYRIHAKTLKNIELTVADEVLKRRVPLRGKEINFLRKSYGLSARKFGELLGLSHVSIINWEKDEDKRLNLITEIAVRVVLSTYRILDIPSVITVLTEVKKAEKFEVNFSDAA